MSMNPPPSRKPPQSLRPYAETLDSQEDNEQHSSDFEDLLEEAHPAANAPTEPSAGATVSEPNEPLHPPPTPAPGLPSTATSTLPPTSPPRSSPSPTSDPPPAPPSSATAPATPKHARLQAQITELRSKISATEAALTATRAQLAHPERADAIVRAHIELLHAYNAVKDVGLGLMGLIAEGRGVRLAKVMDEFGVGGSD